ncbi:unnamed protein product [Nesidiocoris tenuis]|uniref:Uncharacterized protein n=1 Tax=Nesidiocoris tenuis TaxID=355587 RepID=A0A6H5GDB2_9HEMI|nr:unnamed protein product [Nesidiocoris tenuis]
MLSRFNNRPFDDEEDSSSLDDSATPQSRPVLVLDLMRSASQDTLSTNVVSAWKDGDELSWCGSSNATPLPTLEPPDRIGSSATHLNSEIFDDPTLRHLRRSLTLEQAEGEFRRIVRHHVCYRFCSGRTVLNQLEFNESKPCDCPITCDHPNSPKFS